MRQYKIQEVEVVDKIFCNRCSKEITGQDVLSVEKRWGYFSQKDGETHRFDLCEECYDEWIASFQIPIEIE